MIQIGDNNAALGLIVIRPNINGKATNIKIAQISTEYAEGDMSSIALIVSGGNNYTEFPSVSIISCSLHRSNSVSKGINTLLNKQRKPTFYYRIEGDYLEIWCGTEDYPNHLSISVLENNFGRWEIGELERSDEDPGGFNLIG